MYCYKITVVFIVYSCLFSTWFFVLTQQIFEEQETSWQDSCKQWKLLLSKTNQMYNISHLSYFGTTLYTFHLLASSHRTCMTYTWCCMYSLRPLMMEGETVRNV